MAELFKVKYNKLWKMLIDKNMKKKDLQRLTKLSANVISKMGRGETVHLDTLAKICTALQCQLSDIVEIVFEKCEV